MSSKKMSPNEKMANILALAEKYRFASGFEATSLQSQLRSATEEIVGEIGRWQRYTATMTAERDAALKQNPSRALQEDSLEQDLSILVRRLCGLVNRMQSGKPSQVVQQSLDFLKQHGLDGSPVRLEVTEN